MFQCFFENWSGCTEDHLGLDYPVPSKIAKGDERVIMYDGGKTPDYWLLFEYYWSRLTSRFTTSLPSPNPRSAQRLAPVAARLCSLPQVTDAGQPLLQPRRKLTVQSQQSCQRAGLAWGQPFVRNQQPFRPKSTQPDSLFPPESTHSQSRTNF